MFFVDGIDLRRSPHKIITSDEKWFMLKQHPNLQNERYCGLKVMCCAGLVEGKTIIHWFDPNVSVNGDTYPTMLYGGTVHTTISAWAWLESKFGDRVISRLTARPWPAKSPDLSPLDFWFWSVALAECRRAPPPPWRTSSCQWRPLLSLWTRRR